MSEINAEVAVIKNDVKWIKDKIVDQIANQKDVEKRVSIIENNMSKMIGYASGAGAVAGVVGSLFLKLI